MKNVLKNWWLQILAALLVCLESGYGAISPILLELHVPEVWLGKIKVAFLIFAFLSSKVQLPTGNLEKMQDIIDDKYLKKRKKFNSN